jgi:hypothetical protein
MPEFKNILLKIFMLTQDFILAAAAVLLLLMAEEHLFYRILI